MVIENGTTIYRNKSKQWDDELSRDTASRVINIEMTLRIVNNFLTLDISDQRGNAISTSAFIEIQPARTPQLDARRRVLEKVGGTIYNIVSINDIAGDIFIPASMLTVLRRDAIEKLDIAQRLRYQHDYRLAENKSANPPMGTTLSYHDNVSNRLAQQFYNEHGVTSINPALEVQQPQHELVVMTTRYCLRRELDCCLKSSSAKKLPSILFIESGSNRFRIDFDCKKCQMKVVRI